MPTQEALSQIGLHSEKLYSCIASQIQIGWHNPYEYTSLEEILQ